MRGQLQTASQACCTTVLCLLLYCLMSTVRLFLRRTFCTAAILAPDSRIDSGVYSDIHQGPVYSGLPQLCHTKWNVTQTCCSVRPYSSNSSGFPLWICAKLKTSIKQKCKILFPLSNVMSPKNKVWGVFFLLTLKSFRDAWKWMF